MLEAVPPAKAAEAEPRGKNWSVPERHSLSALCGGKAANHYQPLVGALRLPGALEGCLSLLELTPIIVFDA